MRSSMEIRSRNGGSSGALVARRRAFIVWPMSDPKPVSRVPPPAQTDAPPKTSAPPPKKLPEHGGPEGPEPTRYGDWERKGRCIDF